MDRDVVLSDRLKALAEMVTVGNRVCDVGCDHGFVSIYLVQKGISPHALAMDVRNGPLSRAREHIREQGLEDYIETRLSDGVGALCAGEAETLICAGMGGRLMMKILSEGREKCRLFREMILQPQSEVMQFRAFLRKERYCILDEDMVEEDGKFYFLIKASAVEGESASSMPLTLEGESASSAPLVPGGKANPGPVLKDTDVDLYDRFGEKLLSKRHPVLFRFLEFRKRAVEGICQQLRKEEGPGALKRLSEMKRELEEIEKGLSFYGSL